MPSTKSVDKMTNLQLMTILKVNLRAEFIKKKKKKTINLDYSTFCLSESLKFEFSCYFYTPKISPLINISP